MIHVLGMYKSCYLSLNGKILLNVPSCYVLFWISLTVNCLTCTIAVSALCIGKVWRHGILYTPFFNILLANCFQGLSV
jgi:hypothetical protein